MINEQIDMSEESYESMWRKPDNEEIKFVSGLVHINADYHKSTIKISIITVVFLSVVSIAVFILGGGINKENESWFVIALLFILPAVVYLCIIFPKLILKPKWTDEGHFVVTDTSVVSKEIYKARTSGGTTYTYYIKVKVIASNQGNDNDYRMYRIDSFDYNKASVGSPGIIVRYDTKLDGRPFMWMDHYLTKNT